MKITNRIEHIKMYQQKKKLKLIQNEIKSSKSFQNNLFSKISNLLQNFIEIKN